MMALVSVFATTACTGRMRSRFTELWTLDQTQRLMNGRTSHLILDSRRYKGFHGKRDDAPLNSSPNTNKNYAST